MRRAKYRITDTPARRHPPRNFTYRSLPRACTLPHWPASRAHSLVPVRHRPVYSVRASGAQRSGQCCVSRVSAAARAVTNGGSARQTAPGPLPSPPPARRLRCRVDRPPPGRWLSVPGSQRASAAGKTRAWDGRAGARWAGARAAHCTVDAVQARRDVVQTYISWGADGRGEVTPGGDKRA